MSSEYSKKVMLFFGTKVDKPLINLLHSANRVLDYPGSKSCKLANFLSGIAASLLFLATATLVVSLFALSAFSRMICQAVAITADKLSNYCLSNTQRSC